MTKVDRVALASMAQKYRGMVAAIFLAIPLVYILWRCVVHPEPEIDFRYFWVAGQAWKGHTDPYSPLFAEFARSLVKGGNQIVMWAYPPQWWAICVPLSMVDINQAITIWRLAGSLLALTSTFTLAYTLPRRSSSIDPLIGASFASCLILVEPTAQAIASGQSSLIIFGGVAMLALGYIRQSISLIAFSLVLCLLKPQVGLPLILIAICDPRKWKAIFIACSVTIVAAMPQLLSHGIVQTCEEMLTNFTQYGRHPSNQPDLLTGAVQIAAQLGGGFPPIAGLISASAITIIGGRAIARSHNDAGIVITATALCIAAVGAFAPLHSYDLTLLILPVVLAWGYSSRSQRVALAIATLLLIRPGKIESALSSILPQVDAKGGVLIGTIAAFVILFIAGLAFAGQRAAVNPV